jgi:hypothetical protein
MPLKFISALIFISYFIHSQLAYANEDLHDDDSSHNMTLADHYNNSTDPEVFF